MHRPVRRETLANARKLRNDPTLFERALWRELRKRNGQGYHFRRQVPFRGYILDFVEHGARLIVEIDGAHHIDPQQSKHDLKRDQILEREGYSVTRFNNGEIQWLGSIVAAITRELVIRKAHPPTRNAARSDLLPTRGGIFGSVNKEPNSGLNYTRGIRWRGSDP